MFASFGLRRSRSPAGVDAFDRGAYAFGRAGDPPDSGPKGATGLCAGGVKLTVTKTEVQDVKFDSLELPGPVVFNEDQATLKPESDAVLELVYKHLRPPRITKLRIEGHTDTGGDDAHNMELSKARAYAVAKWLVAKGIDCNRLVAVGFGETRLKITPETTPEDRLTNRRVDFIDAERNHEAIGGLPLDGGGRIAGNVCQ